ncbi:TPA: SIR2 family protein [Klebsiella aerogenes]|nr:SIR2 family protein [Klebsiella aerogenes]HDT2318814.1 SIR2 family protein [Klebsiella aerogenes]HDU6101986.1 SIR2 family protein [Klebsiella aerogenes]
MSNHLASTQALLSAVTKSKKPLTILLGSPSSAPDSPNALGVSSVTEIVGMIEDAVKKEDLFDEFSDVVTSKNSNERYQDGFDFIKNYISQDAVNDIIKKAVLKAYNDKTDSWYIPRGLNALCSIISSGALNVSNIVTTNFDPLIGEGIKSYGMYPFRTIFHTDGSWNHTHDDMPNSVNVVHLHGFWEGSDTLHTPKQLTTKRPQLKSSLSQILKNTTVIVVAYGGWDDIFIEALNDIALDTHANVDVVWAFYEKDESIVQKKYEKLLSNVKNIIQRGRFRSYFGIECNDFFMSLKAYVEKKDSLPLIDKKGSSGRQSISFDTVKSEIKNFIMSSSESSTNFPFEPLTLKRYPAHRNIRLVEQTQFVEEMRTNRILSLFSEWGMERNGFLYSLIENSASPLYKKQIYSLNLKNCLSIEDVDNHFNEKFGQGLHNFVMLAAEEKDVVILFDEISSLDNSAWRHDYIKLTSVLMDYIPNLLIINCGDNSLVNLNLPIISLKSLSEPDIKTYILEHPEGDSDYLTQACFDSIVRLSAGLPSRLNNIITQLKISGIATLLEDEHNQRIDFEEYSEDDPIPVRLKESLLNFIKNRNDTKHYSLLKVLSILQYGETYSRLRRFNPKSPFSIDDFITLSNEGLITTSEKVLVLSDRGFAEKEPVHVIHPLVGIYIRQDIDREEYFSIVRKYLDITFGDNWIGGDIKFNQSSLRYLHDFNKSGPGNAHILICAFLRYAVENDARREIKATFNLALSFFKFLENNDRYRDLVFSASEVKALIKESSEIIPLGRLHFSLAKGLRMLGHKKESIDEMLLALEHPSLFEKKELASCKLEIALAYSNYGNLDNDTIKYAQEVKQISKKDSAQYTQAELLLAETSPLPNRIKNIRIVQRKAERLGFNVIKSQAILAITKLQKNNVENTKLFESALRSLTTKESYSIYSVIVQRNLDYLDQNRIDEITDADVITLCKAYSYFYTQRIDVLLKKTHRILWAVFVDRKDNDSLIKMFRYSSFIWRLNNDKNSEEKYANLLSIIEMNISDSYLNELVKYARVRIRILKKVVDESV